MKVFVTGATGFVGSAVVRRLFEKGYSVRALARSDGAADKLKAIGVEVIRGSMDDKDRLHAAALASDAVIHTAFDHDFTRFNESCLQDQNAILVMGDALKGSARPLIVTAGLAHIAPGRIALESDAPAANPSYPRVSDATAQELAASGVNAMVVRLPPSVHGQGDHGFVPMLIAAARAKGVSAYIGDGENLWPAVHQRDAALLYRLALEKGGAGDRFHAAAETGIPFREIAAAIGRGLGVPVVSLSDEEAVAQFSWLAAFVGMDARASTDFTCAKLGWLPNEAGLIFNIENSGYI
jgi:nucleoside-diphosphate-sugar epimerase